MRRYIGIPIAVFLVGLCAWMLRDDAREIIQAVMQRISEHKTTADRIAEFGAAVHGRLRPDFDRLGVAYPPKGIVLLGLKQEKQLEVWVTADGMRYQHLRTYPIRAASGKLGPKLRQGDSQVPEGTYRVESLNPNSLFHLALRLDYPNAFDRAKAKADGRKDLGGDIMIHGRASSIGCLAMGDAAAEDLFVLAAETGLEHVDVLIAPLDFRVNSLEGDTKLPAWSEELYAGIRERIGCLR